MEKTSLPHDHGGDIKRALRRMPEAEHFADAAQVFQQLCDPTRLRILWILLHCEECGVNLAAAMGMSRAAVSHHLQTLKLNGLITSRRSGKEVYYTMAKTETTRLVHQMVGDFFQLICPNLDKPESQSE